MLIEKCSNYLNDYLGPVIQSGTQTLTEMKEAVNLAIKELNGKTAPEYIYGWDGSHETRGR